MMQANAFARRPAQQEQHHESSIHEVVHRSWVFFPLYAPFGISTGYVSVTLAFLLSRAGVGTAAIGALIALSIWPQTWRILWAPIIDTVGNPKLWYGVGVCAIAVTIVLMSILPATMPEVPLLGGLVVLSSLGATLICMATDIFMTHGVAENARGSASGWSQVGNLGGAGVGGGLGLALAEHGSHPWVSGAVLAAISFSCWGAVLLVPTVVRTSYREAYGRQLLGVLIDVWTVVRSRIGFLALIVMLLPLSSGQVPWAAISREWHVGADLVALIVGVIGGLASALGALIGGYICNRVEAKLAYCLFGLGTGAVAALMILMPYEPEMFVIGVLTYQLVVGAGFAAYGAVVLAAIGRRSAATNFSFMASLSNIPIALMATFDGWVHDAYGSRVMLIGELALPAVTISAFAVFVVATRPHPRRMLATAL